MQWVGSKGLNRANVLELLVHARGWTVGCELGVWRGDIQFHLLTHCPNLRMTGVDRWQCYEPIQKDKTARWWPYLDVKAMREAELRAQDVAKQFPGRCSLLKGDTVQAARIASNESFDFVFVDAEHSLQAVRDDIAAWLPKIKPGGAMLGHDFDWWSVEQAVREAFPEGVHVLPDKVWIKWL